MAGNTHLIRQYSDAYVDTIYLTVDPSTRSLFCLTYNLSRTGKRAAESIDVGAKVASIGAIQHVESEIIEALKKKIKTGSRFRT
ncbi:hypothetical protein DFA_10582 [Cavenderia fasciculata]|uniref:Uncharacterized protein n=1 Tax=Cavenderia fasciculata TaxID=261658 RepID=F4QAM0_CACFS|nr:uncharacterized protein DFA_10582 [Cavenderia fasciculata]EGG15739.1 hypothetical protein DFA_10582 [Cavenderia fasciculata]|eukprot:XP_004354486.1 hypothetical protein DFA_10582 [Cavenderia fasciculata]